MKESSPAYAKINISLDIVSKMENGYHNLKTIMQSVSLCDEITVKLEKGEGITVKTELPYVPSDERNIAVKAAKEFYSFTEIKGYKTDITINKKNTCMCRSWWWQHRCSMCDSPAGQGIHNGA